MKISIFSLQDINSDYSISINKLDREYYYASCIHLKQAMTKIKKTISITYPNMEIKLSLHIRVK